MKSSPKLLIVANIGLFFSKFLYPHADHFRRLGWRVDGAAADASSYSEAHEHFDQLFDIEWTRNPLDPQNHFFRAIEQVRRLVQRERYDIVHVHTPTPAFIVRYALRNLNPLVRPKVIYTAHGFHFHPKGKWLKNLVFRALERTAGSWTDHLVVMNEEDYAAANRHRIVKPENLWYMPGIGVDLHRYTPDLLGGEAAVARVRAELGLSPDQPTFLMAAEFIPRKRHKDAVLAFAALKHPRARLLLAGQGKLLEPIKKLVQQMGLAERVHFLGWRQDIPALIQAASATLLTSEQEGLPRAIMESLCMGVPVIGTDIRGAHELIREGCGWLVEVGDVRAIAEAMEWVIAHPNMAKAMGQRGRERMKTYDLRLVLSLHEQLYAKVLYGVPRTLSDLFDWESLELPSDLPLPRHTG
ncbi:MAG: glycosyltransferase family 4 protein [Meiothermus sp.]|nr:glycosyltransferase family 4 protein [Meiothermus sp.]